MNMYYGRTRIRRPSDNNYDAMGIRIYLVGTVLLHDSVRQLCDAIHNVSHAFIKRCTYN